MLTFTGQRQGRPGPPSASADPYVATWPNWAEVLGGAGRPYFAGGLGTWGLLTAIPGQAAGAAAKAAWLLTRTAIHNAARPLSGAALPDVKSLDVGFPAHGIFQPTMKLLQLQAAVRRAAGLRPGPQCPDGLPAPLQRPVDTTILMQELRRRLVARARPGTGRYSSLALPGPRKLGWPTWTRTGNAVSRLPARLQHLGA